MARRKSALALVGLAAVLIALALVTTVASVAARKPSCRSTVTVHGVWGDGEAGSCKLCPDGTCTIESRVQRGDAPLTFTVTGIEDASGYHAYDPASNHVESITVYPPGSQQANPRLYEEMAR